MNEIQAALKKKGNIKERVALYEKYGTDAGLKLAFRTQINQRRIIETLDFHLKRLRWRPDIDKYIATPKKKKPGRKPADYTPPPPPYVEKKPEDSLYPDIIAKLIQDRAQAANLRDKAGRLLVQQAEGLGKIRRAALVAEQKTQHKIVVAKSAAINNWKDNGILPDVSEANPELSPEEIAAYEKKWLYYLKDLSRIRKSLRENNPESSKFREADYVKAKFKFKKTNEALDELAKVLGKTRKKPDEGYKQNKS